MSASLNEACMAGNVDEVMMRLNLGEDVNQVILATAEDPGSNPARVYVRFFGENIAMQFT
jgi:hypothetical protein